MSLKGNASLSNYWQAFPPAPSLARPIWLSAWVSSTNITWYWFYSGFFGVPTTDGSGPMVCVMASYGTFAARTLSTASQWVGVTGPATQLGDGSWNHMLYCETSATSRELFVNGVSAQKNTANFTIPLALDRLLLHRGNYYGSDPTQSVAHAVFGTGTPTQAQITALAAGRNPLVVMPAAQLTAYYPLATDLSDLGPNNIPMTQVGTFTPVWNASNPIVDAPPINAVGTAAGTSVASGKGGLVQAVVGTIAGVSGGTAIGIARKLAAGTAAGAGAANAIPPSILHAAKGTAGGSSSVIGQGQVRPPNVLGRAVPPVTLGRGVDVQTVWTPDLFQGDWLIAPPELAHDADLETAVLLSLFTDRRADPDDTLPGAPSDTRGWWGDTPPAGEPPDPIGSKLWLLSREKQTNDVRLRAEDYCRDALAWMLDDGAADQIDVSASYPQLGWLVLQIDIYRASNLVFTGRYGPFWAAEARQGTNPGVRV